MGEISLIQLRSLKKKDSQSENSTSRRDERKHLEHHRETYVQEWVNDNQDKNLESICSSSSVGNIEATSSDQVPPENLESTPGDDESMAWETDYSIEYPAAKLCSIYKKLKMNIKNKSKSKKSH